MKKYIRSKNATSSEAEERVIPVQPPLPLDPPPVVTAIKEEIEDPEYIQNSLEEQPPEINAPEPIIPPTEFKPKEPESKSIMCRDFIRGKCTRIGCKYSHKCDVSQLVGVYTFCNDYQNSVCTRATCKYVHANVFEEQHFYRTGELPAKAFAHHKSNKNLPPPPPPPPEDPPVNIPTDFKVPPPPMPVSYSAENPAHINMGISRLDSQPYSDLFRAPAGTSSTMRDDWQNVGNFCNPLRELHPPETRKRCNNCNTVDLKLEFMKQKMEKLIQRKEERSHSMEIVSKKNERLKNVLALLKPMYKVNLGSILSTMQTLPADRQRRLFEQLKPIIANDNDMQSERVQEEANRNINANSTVADLLARLWDASKNT